MKSSQQTVIPARYSKTKIGSLVMTLAIVLVTLGAGLSYIGYNESLQPLTLTRSESFSTISTKTIAITATEPVVVTGGWSVDESHAKQPHPLPSHDWYCGIDARMTET